MAPRELKGSRYLTAKNECLKDAILNELPFMDFWQTLDFYETIEPTLDDFGRALLDCNDRYYLLTITCHRQDAWHPWLFERCREVEASPDGHLDLWARGHYKSSIGTFAGVIQEIMIDPEITIAIMSGTNKVAIPFLTQIQQEFENNEDLKRIHQDVLWQQPRKEAPIWARDKGLVVKRKGRPKECTIEAFGVVDGMRTGRHFDLLDYDDLIDESMVDNPEIVKKVTSRWELSGNLGRHTKTTRKWHWGTRYSYADSYGVMLERSVLKARIHPATEDGKLTGKLVLMKQKEWEKLKVEQRSTVAAQMLLNPLAGGANTFSTLMFRHYDVIPSILNVYIMVDPSKGKTARSDRSAIAVIGIDVAGNKYLLDGYCHRMKLSRRWELMKQLKKKWENHQGVQVLRVGYEQYGMQSDLEVIEENMAREKNYFEIEELNTPQQGKHSKPDRISRLEPDFNRQAFYLPAVVYHPDFGGQEGNQALWDVWTEEDAKRMEDAGAKATTEHSGAKQPVSIGHIVYRPMMGPTRQQKYCQSTFQVFRVVTAIRRRDEDGNMYDLTRVFIEEARFHPFGQHDDLLDASSRIYDMEPISPVPFEGLSTEMAAHPD